MVGDIIYEILGDVVNGAEKYPEKLNQNSECFFTLLRMVAFCRNLPRCTISAALEQQMLSLLLRELGQLNNLSKHTRA